MRHIFLVLALVLSAITVLVEVGSAFVLPRIVTQALTTQAQVTQSLLNELPPDVRPDYNAGFADQLKARGVNDKPPGLAIPFLALLDGVILFTLASYVVGLILPARMQGLIQGPVGVIFSLVLIPSGLGMIFIVAIPLLILMVALLLAIPFGTIVYFIIYGHFDRGSAAAVLSLLMTMKISIVVLLGLTHPDMLKRLSIVLLVLSSIVGNVIISFLHGLVPRFLVSITDDIAAIVVAACGLIWLIPLLIGALLAIVKSIVGLKPDI